MKDEREKLKEKWEAIDRKIDRGTLTFAAMVREFGAEKLSRLHIYQCCGFEARPGAHGIPQCPRVAVYRDHYCKRHRPDVLRRKQEALHAEAAMNTERIRAVGGARVNARVKPSNIVAYGEALHDPDARQYTREGFPVFNNLNELRNYAAIKKAKEGRRMRIDPDGGPPTSADKRKEAEAWRARRAQRGAGRRKRPGFGSTFMKAIGRTE